MIRPDPDELQLEVPHQFLEVLRPELTAVVRDNVRVWPRSSSAHRGSPPAPPRPSSSSAGPSAPRTGCMHPAPSPGSTNCPPPAGITGPCATAGSAPSVPVGCPHPPTPFPPVEQVRVPQDPVHARFAHARHVRVHHHPRQAPLPFPRAVLRIANHRLLFLLQHLVRRAPEPRDTGRPTGPPLPASATLGIWLYNSSKGGMGARVHRCTPERARVVRLEERERERESMRHTRRLHRTGWRNESHRRWLEPQIQCLRGL